ncbi:NAD(P)-dependent oxidoreductase [Psychromarinibacter sp. C21-152]|uniref:NAD(P)-dependent oxidoreductase n=1 Tax=Psychromarinibacter sediminicola TaxID=3033385 RepID=A0AAE3NV05_9RHOB|nr:NAD(P)-dependent oxidoreductase [Psychromarinibacter sediminicola]MDF0602521.1 NAD(P)-dependent oxidoreductase [Psychromarinibacter sediminicola]
MKRLLITGAAGNLGAQMRTRLAHLADTVRLSDRGDMGQAGPNEETVPCDLGDRQAVEDLVKGCDGIVHFGGQANEAPWSTIRNANLDGVYNLYEACRLHGCNRVVFASSNHATGYYKQDEVIDNSVYPRPDGLYGVSKVFGEMMASLYHDKFGIETASIRIGSSFPEPRNHRMLYTWLSYDDLARLIERIFDVPKLGCPVIYGASANDQTFWDNSRIAWLGWRPQDNSAAWKEKLDAEVEKPAADAPDVVYQGGMFTADGIHQE